MLLNITNGDYLNALLSTKYEGEFFPFREAIIQGEVTLDIFSEEFIKTRALSLGVSEDLFRQNVSPLLEFSRCHNKYSKLMLWFGKDTFCQLNLLTLLAFLEQVKFKGQIAFNLVDDETGDILKGDIKVELGRYLSVYRAVFCEKQIPNDIGILDKRALELYFDYLSPDGYLTNLIKENDGLTLDELVILLINSSKEYGLSDLNIMDLIAGIKK